MNNLTPEQKLKYEIIDLVHICENGESIRTDMTGEDIEDMYDESDTQEAEYEIRSSGVPTHLPTPSSRHYETEAVAVQCPTGEWVGFTYWYGGGKHGNPEEIDWIEHAYDVTHSEEQKMVTVHTFKIKG